MGCAASACCGTQAAAVCDGASDCDAISNVAVTGKSRGDSPRAAAVMPLGRYDDSLSDSLPDVPLTARRATEGHSASEFIGTCGSSGMELSDSAPFTEARKHAVLSVLHARIRSRPCAAAAVTEERRLRGIAEHLPVNRLAWLRGWLDGPPLSDTGGLPRPDDGALPAGLLAAAPPTPRDAAQRAGSLGVACCGRSTTSSHQSGIGSTFFVDF
jgi:hypothetical protein